MIKGILLNPLILGTAAGFLLWQLHVPLPGLIETPLRKLAGIATPLALFLLGASLDFRKARDHLKLITISVLGRLVAVPLLFLSIAVAAWYPRRFSGRPYRGIRLPHLCIQLSHGAADGVQR